MELQLPFTGQDPLDLLQVVDIVPGSHADNLLDRFLCCLVHAFVSRSSDSVPFGTRAVSFVTSTMASLFFSEDIIVGRRRAP